MEDEEELQQQEEEEDFTYTQPRQVTTARSTRSAVPSLACSARSGSTAVTTDWSRSTTGFGHGRFPGGCSLRAPGRDEITYRL